LGVQKRRPLQLNESGNWPMTPPASLLESLLGMAVTQAEIVHDYLQLRFGIGTGMSIYNKWNFVPDTAALHDLVGHHVTAVHSSADEVVFDFDNEARLVVDLSAIAWKGPEAIQLDRLGLPTVIWN